MKVRCTESFSIEKSDDDGFIIENKYVEIEKDTIWEVIEKSDKVLGGQVKISKCGGDQLCYLKMSEEYFNKCFESINQ